MISRRRFLDRIGKGSLLAALAAPLLGRASDPHAGHSRPAAAGTLAGPGSQPVPGHAAQGITRTVNGWSLPPRLRDGVKEFHLVAEEIEHEFAPGCVAKCWGYNGSTPGPTLEAVEGDRVRIFVTNRLKEHTTIHWHGILLPSGMDGVGGLSQPAIQPGETFIYEFTLNQHGTHLYHPHADEMVQLAFGMMGFFIIHPKVPEPVPVDRDYALLLHNWALHPGTWRPDPAIMTDFNLWTFNSKVFPAIEPLVARSGERVRIRVANLSMHEHPVHVHGVRFDVTGGDGGRWPREQWRSEVTEIVGVGQARDIEFTAVPGDWALHCHKSHHTMNAMGHDIANSIGVDQSGVADAVRKLVPGYMPMGEHGMAEHQAHTDSGHMPGPPNTLPMMGGHGPYGRLEMGGMFTVVKVRDDLAPGDFSDPGWYRSPPGETARRATATETPPPLVWRGDHG